MDKYTIAERQAIKDRLADESHFERDRELFSQLFPHHPMLSELARANRVNKPSLCRRMIYQMLLKVDEATILENRASSARVPREAAAGHTIITGLSPENQPVEAPSVPAAPVKKKNLKAEEFPRIDWANNQSEDIQLAILLYDERVSTWQQLIKLRQEIDDYPEKALAIADLDDRNRMAHHELEVFQDTGIFPCKHPIAVKFMADRKKLAEWRALKAKDPKAFMRQVANLEHNITRYRSQLKKDKLTKERREAIERNLANSERLNELMQQVLKE